MNKKKREGRDRKYDTPLYTIIRDRRFGSGMNVDINFLNRLEVMTVESKKQERAIREVCGVIAEDRDAVEKMTECVVGESIDGSFTKIRYKGEAIFVFLPTAEMMKV